MGIKVSNYAFVRSIGYSWYVAGAMFLTAILLWLLKIQPDLTLVVIWASMHGACVIYQILGGLYIGWVLRCNTCGVKVGEVIANSFDSGHQHRKKVIFEGLCPCCEAKITGLMFEKLV